MNLYIYSGECNKGKIGVPVGAVDAYGNPLHVGDIVILWAGRYIGTDLETWDYCGGLTAIVDDCFTTFSNGVIEMNAAGEHPYCMGIKGCAFNHKEWRIQIVKSYKDVIEGETWPAYGFSYRASVQADKLLENKEGV